MSPLNQSQSARYLDHAVLKPEMSTQEAKEAIQLGIDWQVRSVCVRPCDIEIAVEMCCGTKTEVSCVLGFPHGCGHPLAKAQEAELYVKLGVQEIDMVANYGWIRSGLWSQVEQDIKGVVEIAHSKGVLVKVIFETSQLTLEQISKATEVSIAAGADFVKTSTGFNGTGASEEGVEVMLQVAQGRIQVKPSGGIRDYARAKMFIDKGCNRLGVNYSSTPEICQGELNAVIGQEPTTSLPNNGY